MKQFTLFFCCLLLALSSTAQVSKTLNLTTAGTLTSTLTATEKTTVTNLTLTGNIDARDVQCMRDEMTKLAVLNISGATIKATSGYPANEMPWYSFYNGSTSKATLTTIQLPTSITSIGYQAFYKCHSLRGSLIIPNTVKTISDYAFYYCSGLTSLTLSNTLTTISSSAFNNCTGLTGSLVIPNSVTSIGSSAFNSCSGLTSLTLSNTLTTISSSAFYNCTGLTGSLVIPNSVTSIGEQAFYYCTGLTSLTLSNTLTTISSYAFQSCKGLSSVTIPATVTSISSQAFYGCNLKITCQSTTPPTASLSSMGTSIVFVPTGTAAAYTTAWGTSSTAFILDKDIEVTVNVTEPGKLATTIYNQIGAHPGTVTKLTVTGTINSADVLYIRDNMKMCYDVNLEGVSLTYLPTDAFQGRTLLFAVKLPSGLITIGGSAFQGCSSIKTMDLPASVTSIGSNAFSYCSGLTAIGMPNVTSIRDWAFYNCSGLTSIDMPKVTSIDYYAFYNCSSLKTIDIPANVTTIYESTFYGCSSLTTVNFGAKVTSIGQNAFSGCSKVSEITCYRLTPPALGTGAFNGIDPKTCKLRILEEADFDAYFSAAQWGSFLNVERINLGGLLGDSNEDGSINVVDVVNIVNYILEKPLTKFNMLYSDMNKDGGINVIDVVQLVNQITTTPSGAPQSAPAMFKVKAAVNATGNWNIINNEFAVQVEGGIRGFDVAYTGSISALPALDGFSISTYTKNGVQRLLAYTIGNVTAAGTMTPLFTLSDGGTVSDMTIVTDNGSTASMSKQISTATEDVFEKGFAAVNENKVVWKNSSATILSMQLYSTSGALLASSNTSELSIPANSKGIFVLRVKTSTQDVIRKIVF